MRQCHFYEMLHIIFSLLATAVAYFRIEFHDLGKSKGILNLRSYFDDKKALLNYE